MHSPKFSILITDYYSVIIRYLTKTYSLAHCKRPKKLLKLGAHPNGVHVAVGLDAK